MRVLKYQKAWTLMSPQSPLTSSGDSYSHIRLEYHSDLIQVPSLPHYVGNSCCAERLTSCCFFAIIILMIFIPFFSPTSSYAFSCPSLLAMFDMSCLIFMVCVQSCFQAINKLIALSAKWFFMCQVKLAA